MKWRWRKSAFSGLCNPCVSFGFPLAGFLDLLYYTTSQSKSYTDVNGVCVFFFLKFGLPKGRHSRNLKTSPAMRVLSPFAITTTQSLSIAIVVPRLDSRATMASNIKTNSRTRKKGFEVSWTNMKKNTPAQATTATFWIIKVNRAAR